MKVKLDKVNEMSRLLVALDAIGFLSLVHHKFVKITFYQQRGYAISIFQNHISRRFYF